MYIDFSDVRLFHLLLLIGMHVRFSVRYETEIQMHKYINVLNTKRNFHLEINVSEREWFDIFFVFFFSLVF